MFRERLTFREKYRLLNILGQGGYGVVYLAETLDKIPKQVAVKTIDRRRCDYDSIFSIRQEAQILQSLSTKQRCHPHIVQFLDYYEEEEYFYLVMEYLPGGELYYDIVKKEMNYHESHARYFIYLILKTIQYVHSAGVIHRDLKMENLLLSSSESDQAIVKIADFGLSVKQRNSRHLMTGAAGSLPYMAPEMLAGKPYGKEVDVWSIGVLAFVLLSGTLPFYHSKDELLKYIILNGSIYFNEKAWSRVSRAGRNFVLKLLSVDRSQRPTIEEALHHPWFSLHECLLTSKPLTFGSTLTLHRLARKWKRRMQLRKEERDQALITADAATPPRSTDEVEEEAVLFTLPPNDPPQTARYQVTCECSKTYFTSIYLGVDVVTGEEVVVKVHDLSRLPSRSIELLFNEIKTLNTLQQPPTAMSAANVLKLHATYEAGGKYYVVEERTSDHEVMDRIAEAISYDEQEAKRLAAGLMQAVALLHSKDIVHRNITPENVVLSSDAVDAVVKLTNFTLAKQLPPPLSSSPQIRVTTPPESLDSTALMSRVEKAGDVWAVGILLHMLLVGKSPSLPLGGEAESEEVKEVELREEDGWSAVSQEAKDLVRGLLRFDPLARLTITQALAHPWLSEHLIQSSESTLSLSWEEIAEVAEEKEEVFVPPSSSSEEGLLVIAPITAVAPEAVLEEQNSQSLEEARRKLRRSYIIKKFQRAIFSLIFIDRVKRCVAMTKHMQAKTIKGRGEDKEAEEEKKKQQDEIKEEEKEMKGGKEAEKVDKDDDDDDDDMNDGCYYEDWNFDPILSYSSYVTSVFSSFYATFTKPVKE